MIYFNNLKNFTCKTEKSENLIQLIFKRVDTNEVIIIYSFKIIFKLIFSFITFKKNSEFSDRRSTKSSELHSSQSNRTST